MTKQSQGRAITSLRNLLAFTLCWLLSIPALCEDLKSVWIYVSEETAQYKSAYDALYQTVAVAPIKIHKILTNSPAPPKEKPDFIISIGTAAAEKVFSLNTATPKLSILVTESGFNELAKRHHKTIENAFKYNYSALVLEQPFLRCFLLGKNLLPSAKKVGILIGPNTHYRQLEAESVANALNLELYVAQVDHNSNPVRTLEPVIANTDFFVVVPDTNAINQTTARWILELSYRHSTPVIGYSARYAESGALAGIFTTPQSLGHQAGQWLLHALISKPTLGQIIGPQDLQIVLNPSVARSNNLKIKDADFYRRLIAPSGNFR